MDVDEGFIAGIYHYCDRWCERCPLTSRCMVFADVARFEAANDPTMAAVVHAPSRPEERPSEPPAWVRNLIEEASRESARTPDVELQALMDRPMPSEHAVTCERAKDYGVAVFRWLKVRGCDDGVTALSDAEQVVAHFALLIAGKVHRALAGLAMFDGDREFPPDHEGSAKVALLGVDRSIEAWLRLAGEGRVAPDMASGFVDQLVIVGHELEATIPQARSFVRPGFDEPDALARLLAD